MEWDWYQFFTDPFHPVYSLVWIALMPFILTGIVIMGILTGDISPDNEKK
jgi:hypothetical protein